VLALLAVALLAAPSAISAPSTINAAALMSSSATPYMGWNTYFGVGLRYDEQTIISVAETMLSDGLARSGYRIVWLDSGWTTGARNRRGELIVNRRQWPHGLRWLTDWLHARGLLAGIYTDAGRHSCGNTGFGSYGHYQQDVDAFASWGFDAVKVDFCGAGQEGFAPRPLYEAFARAIATNSSHRPMLLNVCNFWTPDQINGRAPTLANSSWLNYSWAPAIAQSWRTDTDIGYPGHVTFSDVVRNLGADGAHPQAAGHGHWNDPDYLAPGLGMTDAEFQTQMSMWSIVAAPLIIGSDPRRLSAAEIRMLENPRVLAIDQDRLGIQGWPVRAEGAGEVWVKPLSGGSLALALLNIGPRPVTVTTTARALRLPGALLYSLQNAWTGYTTTSLAEIAHQVPAHSALLFVVKAL
jgi:alpha-galactosidase